VLSLLKKRCNNGSCKPQQQQQQQHLNEHEMKITPASTPTPTPTPQQVVYIPNTQETEQLSQYWIPQQPMFNPMMIQPNYIQLVPPNFQQQQQQQQQ